MSNKTKSKFYLTLVIFSLVGQIAWVIENMYFNVFIYKMFNASASDISLMVGASAVAATLTTVFIGSAVLKNADKIQGSDGTESFLSNANIFIAAAVVVALLIVGIVLYFAMKGKNGAKESEE